MFTQQSRYYNSDIIEYQNSDGKIVQYASRRMIPRSKTSLGSDVVRDGERLDNFAARTIGNAEMFWKIADNNWYHDVFTLAVPGRRLNIPTIK